MIANSGETEVLNYLVQTGPISIADLTLRFDEPPRVVRALESLKQRNEIDIVGTQADSKILEEILKEIESVSLALYNRQVDNPAAQWYTFLHESPAATSIVRLTDKGFRRATMLGG